MRREDRIVTDEEKTLFERTTGQAFSRRSFLTWASRLTGAGVLSATCCSYSSYPTHHSSHLAGPRPAQAGRKVGHQRPHRGRVLDGGDEEDGARRQEGLQPRVARVRRLLRGGVRADAVREGADLGAVQAVDARDDGQDRVREVPRRGEAARGRNRGRQDRRREGQDGQGRRREDRREAPGRLQHPQPEARALLGAPEERPSSPRCRTTRSRRTGPLPGSRSTS